MQSQRQVIESLFGRADIRINGTRPQDITVSDERFFSRVADHGSLGLGESYMEGWWECRDLDQFFCKLLSADLEHKTRLSLDLLWALKGFFVGTLWHWVRSGLVNRQTVSAATKVAKQHYDLSPEFYMSFLDPYNQYTCGYFKDTDDLNIAQEQKLDLICRKLQLKPGDHVLDIGCGWGGFAKFAALRYGCRVTGISISDEQINYAREFTKGLPVEIKKLDYREVTGKFDKILICGMIEHVGVKNYRKILEVVHRNLKDNGLFLLHTIGRLKPSVTVEPWIDKYIFPNGMLPAISQLAHGFEGLFVVEDLHNFGAYYDPTLMSWYRNFNANWARFKDRYGETFYRMWKYYLLSCAGAFRARNIQLWQFVMSKHGVPKGYTSVR